MNSTRAKFRCNAVDMSASGGQDVTLNAVYSEDIQSENGRFTKATPSGQLTMRVDNPDCGIKFEPGKEYYLDISEAPAPAAAEPKEPVEPAPAGDNTEPA